MSGERGGPQGRNPAPPLPSGLFICPAERDAMTMQSLARKVVVARKIIAAQMPDRFIWPTPWEWIAKFEEWQVAGHFSKEPDLPKALAFYRGALEQALAADPSIESRIHGDPHKRREPAFLEVLRIGDRFPDVPVAYNWLMEIQWRVCRGIPPVTEAEFAALGAWFEVYEERLATLADSSGLFDVGCGRRTCCWYIRSALRVGPRVEGAGEVAEDIRRLRSPDASIRAVQAGR
jgi:hypothetical protein